MKQWSHILLKKSLLNINLHDNDAADESDIG